jgi:serine/threonine/tyrosine-interacting protein
MNSTTFTSPFPSVEESAMSDTAITHSRNEEYVFGVPNLPRMLIPPPSFSTPDTLDLQLGKVVPCPDPNLNVEFLNQAIDTTGIKWAVNNWEYSKRRQAQPILPFLYLGPINMAKDRAFLADQDISLVLGIQLNTRFGELQAQAVSRVAGQLGIEKAWIDVRDNQSLSHEIPTAINIINAHLVNMHRQGRLGKVLVFCESGNDRSAAVVAGYLIATFSDVDVVKALQICGARRFCCTFTDDLKHLLNSFEQITRAKRSVENDAARQGVHPGFLQVHPQAANSNVTLAAAHKRGREDDDNDVDMDDQAQADDVERFIGRERSPFQ